MLTMEEANNPGNVTLEESHTPPGNVTMKEANTPGNVNTGGGPNQRHVTLEDAHTQTR